MNILKTVMVLLVGGLILSACNSIDFKKTKGGVAYKIIPGGKSKDSISVGNIIKYNAVRKVIRKGKEDTILQNTYGKLPQFEEVRLFTGDYRDAFFEIVSQAHPGDSIYFEQALDSFIAKQPEIAQTTSFRNGDKLVTSIKILQVFKDRNLAQADYMKEFELHKDEMIKEEGDKYAKDLQSGLENFRKDSASQVQMRKDEKIIEDYLKSKNIQAQKTDWSVYIETITPGQGPKPTYGQFSKIYYKGMHLSGEEFDSGTMDVEIGRSQVVFGFMYGVSQMQKGQRARIYIPSLLAYAQQGREPKIKPNEVLVFEIEVLDITNTQTASTQPPAADSSHAGHGH